MFKFFLSVTTLLSLAAFPGVTFVVAEDYYNDVNDALLAGLMQQVDTVFAQCGIDYNSVLESSSQMVNQIAMGDEVVGQDQVVAEIQAMAVQCTDVQSTRFEKALDDFETCSSIDLRTVLESFADALVGTVIQCTLAIFPQIDQLQDPSFRIPDVCIESFMGRNPVGDLIRSYLLSPDKMLPCFSSLTSAMPECTLEEWPIPLIGKIMKKATCVLGASVELVDELATAQVMFLSTCLVDGNSCEENLDACVMGTPTLILPKPLQGAPLSDAMVAAAKRQGMEHLVDKYNAFVDKCIPDRWAGWAYPMGEYEGSKTYKKQAPAVQQSSFVQETPQGVPSSANGGSNASSSSSSPIAPFMGGLGTGLVLLGGLWAYTVFQKKAREERYDSVELVGNDLSLA